MNTFALSLRTLWKTVPASIRVLWLLTVLGIAVWASLDDTAWDLKVYDHALQSLQRGHDPYRDATDIQKQHHQALAANGQLTQDSAPPYSYVYAPITLPLLKVLGHLPRLLLLLLYWSAYIAGAFGAVAVCATFAEPSEYPAVLALAGVAVCFPGLLANGVILSGNIAYILYGAVFGAALLGWRRNQWIPFYAAILCATCVKAPMLSLILIAPLSRRSQRKPALGVIGIAAGIYSLQPLWMPTLFRHYLEAVELQFSFNHDFGCSLAGLFSNLLYQRGLPYSPGCYFAYAAYALPVFFALLYGARQFQAGRLTLKQWGPVLLVGVLLLNPRIMEYDAAPITLPLALLVWRLARATRRPVASYAVLAVVFATLNALGIYNWLLRKALDGSLLMLIFAGSFWLLLRQQKQLTETSTQSSDVYELASA